ncbi:histidine phosphatase family protein [Endozoicomonas sp. SCSIO W0465]|uniref:histidine phosphatase family protein n=1 Tax=Endozoicomonas sp. SCSIO W0465 TaxID=2918516 RepID=UPI00207584F1|nr:histidine phosphatase family protein [Endozoicomonas sp. SCSIO W0465]USE37228.1 histidine phosphatase family protein [Endozoicomonas sp. SCSIO W0465]
MCVLSIASDAADPEPVMAAPADYLISLVRHGDRSPRDLGDMASYWPMGAGQLTVGGLEQEYLLGKKIRSHYFSESLPHSWSPRISQHFAKGLDRTIQSASALLQGIYPKQTRSMGIPGGIQVPPVYASPLASDDLFSAQRLCPGYLHRVQALENSADWLRKKEQYRDQLASWLEFGKQVGEVGEKSDNRDLYSLLPLIDLIAIHRMHNLPMPKGISRQEAIELESLLNWVVSRTVANYEIAQLIGAPLAKAMIRDIKRVQQCLEEKGSCHACQRWTLYSASDTNLLAIMTMLGAPSDRIVDYATHFGVQLNWNDGRPEIVLSLNHEPFAIPGCVGRCSLNQWLVLLERSLPDDWDYLCARGRGGLTPYPEPYVPSGSVANRQEAVGLKTVLLRLQ